MPLLNVSPLSSFGSVYISSDGTVTGTWAFAELLDWSSSGRKAKSMQYGLDGTPYVSTVALGVKGRRRLFIPSCPITLYNALKALETSSHETATLKHASLGTVVWEVDILAVVTTVDDAWATTDPVRDVNVDFAVFGAA